MNKVFHGLFSTGRKGHEVASISARVIFPSMNYVLSAIICVYNNYINNMAYFLKHSNVNKTIYWKLKE